MTYSYGEFEENRYWIKNTTYQKETYRGLDDREATYSLGLIKWVKPGIQQRHYQATTIRVIR